MGINKYLQKLNPRIVFWIIFVIIAAVFAAIFVNSGAVNHKPSKDQAKTEKQEGSTAHEKEYEPLKILFGGDIFLDRSIRRQIEVNGIDHPWVNIEQFLESFEYKVANLEGPIWNTPTAAPSGSFSFAFQTTHVEKLKDLGFTAVSMANNHTNNQGVQGLASTRTELERMGMEYFGDPNNSTEFLSAKFIYVDDKLVPESELVAHGYTVSDAQMRIAFVGEHDLYGGSGLDGVLKEVAELDKQGYFVVVMPHWGPEYVLTIPKIEQDRAYALIEAGADLIVGAHPHVVQPIEIHQNRVIFYSLGNFLFDQGFSKETMQSLLVEAVFEKDDVNFKLHPTQQNTTFQINLASNMVRTEMLERLSEASLVSESVKQDIKNGEFTVYY